MELNLPVFPPFDAETDKKNAGPRWDRWIGRLENLFIALKLTDPLGSKCSKSERN